MKKLTLMLISLMILSLVESCQKKEEFDNVNVALAVNKPVNNTSTELTTLSGRFITSGKMEMVDHGFDVIAGGTLYHFPLGTIGKPGKIESIQKFPVGDTSSLQVTLYALDKNGKYYSSNGDASAPFQPPVLVTDEHTYDGNFDNFYCNITNNTPATCTIMDYGIEYYDTKASAYVPFSFATGPVSAPSVNANGSISATLFDYGVTYPYYHYVMAFNVLTSQTIKVVGPDQSFVGSNVK